MKIRATAINEEGTLLTESAEYWGLKLRRVTDGYLLDWNDLVFKVSGWTTLETTLTEIDATNLPGKYEKEINITLWEDGCYQADLTFDDDTTLLNFSGEQYVMDGREVQYNTDVLTSSRATSADIVTSQNILIATISTLAIEANIESHVTSALNLYDGPTKAELDTAIDSVVDTIPVTKINELYTLFGLDPAYPLLVTLTARTVGGINQTISIDTVNQRTSVTRV